MSTKYMVLLRRYDGIGKPLVRGISGFNNITKARAYAYKLLDHKTSEYNKMGEYKAEIISDYNLVYGYKYYGEVLNTADDDRYWYPDRKMILSKYRKYPLNKDGTLGKGMW